MRSKSVSLLDSNLKISFSLITRRLSLFHHYQQSQIYQQHFSLFQIPYRVENVPGGRRHGHSDYSNVNLSMGPDKSNYRDQGVQGGSQFESPNRQFRNRVRYEREEEECRRGDVEGAEGLSWRKRRQPLVDDEYTDSLGAQEERSLASYGSWEAGSQALGISTSGSKPETFLAPYGTYDMDDSSFFAHTTRLNIVGPKSDSTRILGRRSSCAERSLGERTMATSFQKTERLRSSSPAVVPTKPTSPTESYMKLSLQFSHPLVDPTTSRKLLVLDLNGTLLLRSSRRAPPPPYFSSKRPAPHPHPALRIVYPRPYLPSFRAYLFHPTTLQWLDTMVWSSAQPHSVNDMVDKCFGMYRKDLKAVWARDTLGLTGDEYCEYNSLSFFG